MRLFICWLAFSTCLFAAIGDNAPSVPPTWVNTHPRLPYPDNTFLQAICTNDGNPAGGVTNAGDGCHMVARYRTAAGLTQPQSLVSMRYLLIAYAATVWNGTPNATYLSTIKSFSTAYTSGNAVVSEFALAMAYDWFHVAICNSDGGTIQNGGCVGSTTLNTMRSTLYTILTNWFNFYTGDQDSPYNDRMYISNSNGNAGLIAASAIYPDDAANSLPWLRKTMDIEFNTLLPAWKDLFGQYPFAAAPSSNLGGGGWHESWSTDYIVKMPGMTTWIVPQLLAFASASGKGTSYVFGTTCGTKCNPDQYPWLKNFAHFSMYERRPDWVSEPIDNSNSSIFFVDEYGGFGSPTTGTNSSNIGVLDSLAAIYNDPVLRYWSRTINWSAGSSSVNTPDGNEPTAWPYFTPDNCGTGTSCVLPPTGNLATVRDFPGWGTVFFRTGWGEDDTYCWLKYGDDFWSHPAHNVGAWGCFNRGPLAIHSAGYTSGSNSFFAFNWAGESVSQNTIAVCDPADRYSDETFGMFNYLTQGGSPNQNAVAPNDCGQRRTGSGYSNQGNISGWQQSPFDAAHRARAYEFDHRGKLVAFAVHPSGFYAYAAVDQTRAYNNRYSLGAHTGQFNPYERNSVNRSPRVQKAIRHLLWTPRGRAAYVVIYDQVISTSSSFTKKYLVHSINQPTISGNSYQIARTELVNSVAKGSWPKPWAGNMTHCPAGCQNASQYQYNGKLYGWFTWPTTGQITTVGGSGAEFKVVDPAGNTANDINLNECMQYLCSSEFGTVIATAATTSATITLGVNDGLSVAIDGGATQNITLAAGAGLTCAQIAADLNSKITGATVNCEGMQSPASILAISSNNTTFSGCVAGSHVPSATCSAVAVISGTAAATLSLPSGSAANSLVCAVSYFGTATSGLCSSNGARPNQDIGFEARGGFMHPGILPNGTAAPVKGPQQAGSWRIEELIGANNLNDQLINVMLVTNASDTNVVSTAPVTTSTTLNGLPALQTIWQDNSNTCTYTATFYVDGIGGTLTASGAGCVNTIS